ncbi:hypothetical protein A2U01_0036416, partial [Trifolium medium]|nr:hypothetical protein [Trifolium medium]
PMLGLGKGAKVLLLPVESSLLLMRIVGFVVAKTEVPQCLFGATRLDGSIVLL